MEEIRNLKDSEKSEREKVLLDNDNGMFEYVRKLAIELETTLFNMKNQGSYWELSEGYKDRCKIIYSNIRDDTNLELRRKVINRNFNSKDLVSIPETELYSK